MAKHMHPEVNAMARFTPLSLETSLRNALKTFEERGEVELDDVALYDDFTAADLPGDEVTDATVLYLELVRCDEYIAVTVADFIALAQEVSSPKDVSFDGLTYHSPQRTVIRLEAVDVRSALVIHDLESTPNQHAVSQVSIGSESVSVGLVRRSLHFALTLLMRDYHYDEYLPPLSGDDVFLEVRHARSIDANTASDIGYAYLFELGSSLELRLSLSPRSSSADEYPSEDEIQDIKSRAQRLRPLLVGAGLGPLVREYHRATISVDPENSLVCFVKCIEYVSATVVRERQYDDIRKRLQSPTALSPTAAYMDDLLALFEENRIFTKDHEALKLTVDRCCDPILLAPHAPKCVASLRTIKATSKASERKAALADLSACLSATRNQFAHAKANYELTGKECPPDQLPQLVTCATIAAEQCMRWYASQNPDLRRG
jgi:hypothetical protein